MSHFSNPWKSGAILDCTNDIDACVVTICLPCFVYSENRSMLHGGRTSTTNMEGIDPCLVYCIIMTLSACTLQCLYAYTTRTDIRRKYDLEEIPCDDCTTHFCCHFCALCQEYRELRHYPLTPWPDAFVPGPSSGGVFLQQPQIQQIPERIMYAQSQPYHRPGGASSVASYPAYHGSHPLQQRSHDGSGIPQAMYPALPPQPLTYEAHRLPGQLGANAAMPGIPALVYQVPRYPGPHQPAV